MRKVFVIAVLVLAALVEPVSAADLDGGSADRLRTIIAGDHREPKNAARDRYRHPFETLSFFGLKPHMTVVEIWPGRGWYTEVLAPFVNDDGRFYGASWDQESTSEWVQRNLQGYRAKLAARADLYGGAVITELSRTKTNIAPPGTADMVLTFRNVHNWMKRGYERTIFEAMYEALKPGGVLGLTEHRGDPEVWQDPQALSGYVNEETVIDIAEDVGFRLAAKSEINANPMDTKDHPKGVWTLPPSLRLKDQDRDKYVAIGESDRMTLKFVKPVD